MNSAIAVLLICIIAACNADTPTPAPSPPQPYVGEWNYTYTPHERDSKLCMKLKAGIRLDVKYDTNNGSRIATINSTDGVTVSPKSICDNSTSDMEETLVLMFSQTNTLSLHFTRNSKVTQDSTGNRWQLYKVDFDFQYDNQTFPDSKESGPDTVNTNTTVSGIATAKDRSFSCSRTGTIVLSDRFNITLTTMRVQAFMSTDDFSAADHCASDQETTDLIPIIIGAALAALVIIVLIAYLIGRARANTPSYDNMK